MSEHGMYEVRAVRINDLEVRETDEFIAESEEHAKLLARGLSRVREYAWVEVVYMGCHQPQRIRVFVRGHTVMIG